MRFVLAVAVLINLLPTAAADAHAMDGEHHCAVVAGEGSPAHRVAHHGETPPGDCSHCPPSECPEASHCAAGTLAGLIAGGLAPVATPPAGTPPPVAAVAGASRAPRPPHPPPLTHLT